MARGEKGVLQAKACFVEQKLPYGMWDTKKELPYGIWNKKKELPYGMWNTKKGIALWR